MSSVSLARCDNCDADILEKARTNFYGLRKLKCPQCGHTTTLPMRTGYRVAFYIVALWMAIGLAIRLIKGGNLWVPALILAVAIAALVQDQKIQRTQLGAKRWVGNLHGGQLLIFVLVLAGVGLALIWVGNTMFIVPGNRNFDFAYDTRVGNTTLGLAPDTAAAATIQASALAQGDTGLLLEASGLVVWLLTVLTLWWWFGSRRRKSQPNGG